jgi:hypothetical protein
MNRRITNWNGNGFWALTLSIAWALWGSAIFATQAQNPTVLDTIVLNQSETAPHPKAFSKVRPAFESVVNLNWGQRFPYHLMGFGVGLGIGRNWLISANVLLLTLAGPTNQAIVYKDDYSQRYMEGNANLEVSGFHFRLVRSFFSHQRLHPFISLRFGMFEPDWNLKDAATISAGFFFTFNPELGIGTNLTRWCRPYASIGWRFTSNEQDGLSPNGLMGNDFTGISLNFGITIMRLWQ